MLDDNEMKIECFQCNAEVYEDSSFEIESGEQVCEDCIRVCERCDVRGTDDDNWNTIDNYAVWCENCTGRYAYWCDSCNEYNSDGTTLLSDSGDSLCEGCLDGAYYCESCSDWYSDPCDCADERLVHDYSYRPDPIFHALPDENTRLYFGIEMEMETPNGSSERRNQAAEYAHKLEDNNLAYVKNDGSLECGLELVTHPMTHDFYKQENSLLWEVVNGLKNEHNMRSWSTRTCGLHIHISRAGFNGGSHMHRFLNLIYSNQALYERLAGRKASRWATFDDTLTEPKNVYDEAQERWVIQPSVRTFKHKLGMHSERYSAVNTNNRNTLEIRIFRGTLNESTIKSHLDLAHASVEYTRTLSVRDVAEGALHADRFIKYIYDHSEKYADLCRRLAQMTVSSTDTENV